MLFCAFTEVPGASASGARMAQWLSVFGGKEVDALTLKGREAAHIQRLGGARMMRVPNTSGKPFLERLSTFQRALGRQLAGDNYELVWCADLYSACVLAPALDGTPMIVEIAEVPSQTIGGRQLVGEDAAAVQKRWRDQERVAIRAATKVVLPSRHAAKLLSERVDPRMLAVVPRAVDRAVFVPPSVEVALDDERLVLLFGGREGGGTLRAVVAMAHAIAPRVPANVRIGILGQPSLSDAEVKTALAKKGLGDRVELLDADSPVAVAAALAQAHVVVVPSCAEEELEPFAMPHRALEAMSCGRAVVVTGHEAAFKDAATPGEHFIAVPPRDPPRVADAVVALLEQPERRNSLARAAARHVERTSDLVTRAAEVAAMVAEGTRVTLRLHAPRGDDPDTSSKSTPDSPSKLESDLKRKIADGLESGSDSGPSAVLRADGPSATVPAVGASGSGPKALPTMRMSMPNFGSLEAAPGGMWEGDTYLDGALPQALETTADASQVRAAMLVSSDAQSKAESSAPNAVVSSVPTSLIVQAALEESKPPSSSERDPWAPDTIADGTPVEPGRADPSAVQRVGSKKSLLVDASRLVDSDRDDPTVDLTAEDSALSSDDSSSSR